MSDREEPERVLGTTREGRDCHRGRTGHRLRHRRAPLAGRRPCGARGRRRRKRRGSRQTAARRGAEAVEALADITNPDEVGAMVERAIDAFGKLAILVNNAGITGRDASLSKITDEDWERVLKLNLTATFYCCRAAIPRMREQRSGAVVNVASISGKEGNPNMIPYSVSKAGVICLTKAL